MEPPAPPPPPPAATPPGTPVRSYAAATDETAAAAAAGAKNGARVCTSGSGARRFPRLSSPGATGAPVSVTCGSSILPIRAAGDVAATARAALPLPVE